MRTFEDIVPPSRRVRPDAPDAGNSQPLSAAPLHIEPRQPHFPTATVVVAALVLAIAIAALFFFSGARVEVTPTSLSAAVQVSLNATQASGDLPFVVVSSSKIASQSVPGSGTKAVSSAASGMITVYNTSGTAQRFVSNTRFETAAGLVFRAHTAITVPRGTSAKPGSVTLSVYADQPGAAYNIGPSPFTLPGLAGGPLATKISARSSESFTGGASGQIPIIARSAETAAVRAMQAALAPDLEAALAAQVPTGYILLPGAATTTYAELAPAASGTTGQADVKVAGTVSAVVFPNAALASALAASVPGLDYQGQAIALQDARGLTLTPSNGFPETGAHTFSFAVAGSANLVYAIVPDRIASAVAGKSRTAAQVALSNFPEVKQAVLVLRPFWRSVFPQDPSSIAVTISAPQAK